MKIKKYASYIGALCLGAMLLAACGSDEQPGDITQTASVTSGETDTSAEETTVSEETLTESETSAETETATETTTEAETETTTEVTTTESAPDVTEQHIEYPDIVPLYMMDDYEYYLKGYSKYGNEWVDTSSLTFDIDDPEILYLTVNAHYLRCSCLFGGGGIFQSKEYTDHSAAFELSYGLQTSSDEYVCLMWPAYVNYQSFIDYARSVFTDEFMSRLEDPDITSYNNVLISKISERENMLYCSTEERGINPSHGGTIYRIHEQSDDKVTIERETIFCDMEHFEGDPDYYEPHSYSYIDLVKTPKGWRFDYFPMYDEYSNDIDENGEWLYPEYH